MKKIIETKLLGLQIKLLVPRSDLISMHNIFLKNILYCCVFGLILCQKSYAKSYKTKEGETLEQIALAFYGSSAYHLTLAKLNRFNENQRLSPGMVLNVSDLKAMLFAEGFSKDLTPEVDQVLKARYEFMKIENSLRESLLKSSKSVSSALQKTLKMIAQDFEEAGRGMAIKGKYAESAVRAQQRLEEAGKNLRIIANGEGEKELADTIHRLLAQTWVRMIKWTRREDG